MQNVFIDKSKLLSIQLLAGAVSNPQVMTSVDSVCVTGFLLHIIGAPLLDFALNSFQSHTTHYTTVHRLLCTVRGTTTHTYTHTTGLYQSFNYLFILRDDNIENTTHYRKYFQCIAYTTSLVLLINTFIVFGIWQ